MFAYQAWARATYPVLALSLPGGCGIIPCAGGNGLQFMLRTWVGASRHLRRDNLAPDLAVWADQGLTMQHLEDLMKAYETKRLDTTRLLLIYNNTVSRGLHLGAPCTLQLCTSYAHKAHSASAPTLHTQCLLPSLSGPRVQIFFPLQKNVTTCQDPCNHLLRVGDQAGWYGCEGRGSG